MEPKTIRLEALRLAAALSSDQKPEELIAAAKLIEAYITDLRGS